MKRVILGFWVIRTISPELSIPKDLFVAATLGATSVAITARVLKELGQSGTRTAQVILGASVLDDILGLVLLTIVSGIVVSGSLVISDVLRIIVLAVGFKSSASFIIKRGLRGVFIRICDNHIPTVVAT